MASVFNITTASNTVHLDARGQGEIAFTVSDTSRRHLRGRAKLFPQDPAQKGWLTVVGEPERDLPSGGVQQFTVQASVPTDSKDGKYVFRLDAVSVQNPDEDYSCNRTPNGGTWVETGNVTRDANCFNTGNSNQPYMRVQR